MSRRIIGLAMLLCCTYLNAGEIEYIYTSLGFSNTTLPVKTTLPDITGFALRFKKTIPQNEEIFATIDWSVDGVTWQKLECGNLEFEMNGEEGFRDSFYYSDHVFANPHSPKFFRAHFFARDNAFDIIDLLNQIEFIFIYAGWTDHDLEFHFEHELSSETCSMPAYVGRGPSGWNCPIPDTFASGVPVYYTTVTHLTVHHTAGATATPSDPRATMRSIWTYHVESRGWSDIGYNYLFDHLGNIYQGRYNANLASLDVRGAHASYHNANTVGISIMGNFDVAGVYVATATWQAIYNLFSWKAEQRDIDPYDTVGNGEDGGYWQDAPTVLGHRDWSGASTACPGANCYPLLPTLRDTLAARLSIVIGDDDSIIVDNDDFGFTESATWITGTYSPTLAWAGDYQYASSGETEAFARWAPTLPLTGNYNLFAFYIAGSNRSDHVFVNIVAIENDTVYLDQTGTGAAWHYIGRYAFNAGSLGYVEMKNIGDDSGVCIADAFLWISADALFADEPSQKPNFITAFSVSPNPFNSFCNITLASTASSTIEIFDINGHCVFNHVLNTGKNSVRFDGENCSSGVFFVKVQTQSEILTRKIFLVK